MLRVYPGRGSLMHNRSHRLICGEAENRAAVLSISTALKVYVRVQRVYQEMLSYFLWA